MSKKIKKEKDVSLEVEQQENNLNSELEDYKNKWVRAQADYQNLQREVAAQRSEWVKMSEIQIIEEFLPVFDNFKKAFAYKENLSEDTGWQNWAKGIEYIMKQFQNILNEHKIEVIKTVGEEFDPKFHDAVGEGDGEEGLILKEVDAGYKMGNKVLKAAKVIVGQAIKQ